MFFAEPAAAQFKPATVAAPVGGLNARDSLAAMPESDAIVMQNWWPQPYGCAVRNGYKEWATGMPATVETIAGWYNSSGGQKLFAWSSSGMYDITTRAAVGAALVTGLSNALWETVVVTNAAGNNLLAVNGVDAAIRYSNAGVARIIAGDGIVLNTWAGINPINVVQLCVHQRRLWAVEKNSSVAWYLPPDALQGTFVAFDFGPQFSRGGFLQFLATWTLDDGNGAEDHLIAVSSRGEAVVYGGTNPNDATLWALVGVYYIGAPVAGRRGHAKAGGDQLVLTQRGLVSMTGELVSTKVQDAERAITTTKIQFLVSELVSAYGTLTGWQVLYHPELNMVLMGIPSIVSGGNVQLASNQITNAWTEFTNMDAACWATHNDLLYFGDYDGVVHLAWSGNSDGVLLNDTGGTGIAAVVQQAYSYYGTRGNIKQVGMYRPMFITSGSLAYSTAIVYNFVDQNVADPASVLTPAGSLWGAGLWGTALWSGGSAVAQSWIQAEGMGVAGSLKLIVQSNAEVLWIATDYSLLQAGGIL